MKNILRKGREVFVCALAALLCLPVSAQQDLRKNYTPLKSSGTMPELFTQNIRDVLNRDIGALKNDKDANYKKKFLTSSTYQIDRILRSGNALINDEVTIYLNKLADEILKDNPDLRRQLNIYALKSPVVNAYSFDKGYIFMNIGLIAQAESEAQLAYILCHEMAHFVKQHNINSYIHNEKVIRKSSDGRDFEEKLVQKCQYSREAESEADMVGFELFRKTKYDLSQAEKSFDVLQYAHLPFELPVFKKTFFEGPNYVLPEKYFLKEVSPIKDNSNEDDTRHTHPNTKKRKAAISQVIGDMDASGRVRNILGEQQFERVRELSRMEMCRLYLKKRDYPNALYAAYIQLEKYPDNQYLAEVVSKSLYGLSLYDIGQIKYVSDSYLSSGIPQYSSVESYPQQLYHMINKMPSNEMIFMSLNYTYRAHRKFPESKVIASLTDSMFRLVSKVDWGISGFAHTTRNRVTEQKKDTAEKPKNSKTDLIASLQQETNTKREDTIYYKYMFADLFENDREFAKRFPAYNTPYKTGGNKGSFSTYSSVADKPKSPRSTMKKVDEKIDKVILLEPFFYVIRRGKENELQNVKSDIRQEQYANIISESAQLLNFGLVTIDPGQLGAGDVEKLNDYSVISEWFEEKFDADEAGVKILGTDEIDNIIAKYGTRYVLRTGIATISGGEEHNHTSIYTFLFDLATNQLVYRSYYDFRGKDKKDMVDAKTYQMLYDLKRNSPRS